MRDQGRLVEWFDDKGYGFIQPNDDSKGRVFLHIKDFARPGPRPITGCALEYVVQLDGQGRYKAKQVTYLKAAQTQITAQRRHQHSQAKSAEQTKLAPLQLLAIVYILALAVLSVMGKLPPFALLAIATINVMTYFTYAHDKQAAQAGERRVPENTLHILSFLGGWPAANLAQQRLRHKTQKQPFRQIYFCTIVFNILLIIWWISPLNGWMH